MDKSLIELDLQITQQTLKRIFWAGGFLQG
jgi:hypothetical protein